MTSTIKTTAVFLQPFELAAFSETLPAGEYDIETELCRDVDVTEQENWSAAVIVHLHPRAQHPGLARTLTVPLSELERAIARDKHTCKPLKDFFLEEMLADPMTRMVMRADGMSEADVRRYHANAENNGAVDRAETGNRSGARSKETLPPGTVS